MNLVMLLLTLTVVAAVVAVVAGRLPGGMPQPSSTIPPVRLPDRALTSADVQQLRFVPALRGYRMDQVDDALDRLGREIDRLRALTPPEGRDGAHDLNDLNGVRHRQDAIPPLDGAPPPLPDGWVPFGNPYRSER